MFSSFTNFIFDEFLYSLELCNSLYSGDSVIITRVCGGFDIIIRGPGDFDAFYLWEKVRESGSLGEFSI